MKDCDLGIIDGAHNPELTSTERSCLAALEEQGTGRSAAISAYELANIIEEEPRNLRHLINHLIITHGIPIVCKAGPGGGYYLPGSEVEVDEFYKAFHQRAMTGLVKASRGKKAAFVEIVSQLSLGFDDPTNQEAIEKLRLVPDEDAVPAWVQVVTKFLGRLADDPEKYAAEIRRIQSCYGDIFVPRERIRILKEKTAEFQRLLKEIA